ncbi:MAG: type II secretion system secretin GspD [Nannocystaceae bacterium]
MNAFRRANGVSKAGVGISSALAVALTSLPGVVVAAPPLRTSPRTNSASTSPASGPEISGDEAGLAVNSCKKWQAGRKYTVTVPKEAELESLVQWMMSISCQKFLWNSKIRSGKVTILSPEKITLREAYAAFYAALDNMGLTVEPSGSLFKIVETADAKSLNVPTYPDGSAVPNNDRYVTQLVRLRSVSGSEVLPILKRLKSKQGNVEAVGDLLVITDRGSTIRRLLRLVKDLDHAGTGEKIFFYQLKYADAEQVGQIVRSIFGESGGKAASKSKKSSSKKGKADSPTELTFSRVIVDERTGTIIIVASEADYGTIRRMIEQLDVRLPGGGGRLHFKALKYADPDDVAKVLSQLAQAGSKSGSKSKKGNKSAAQGGASAELFSGDVKISADPATRSLIIMASASDYSNLLPIIESMDVKRKQVYIELYILEMTVTRRLTAGAGGHFGYSFDVGGAGIPDGQAVGLLSSAPTPDASSLMLSPEALSGFAGGLLGPLIPQSGRLLGLDNDIPSFGFILQALSTHNDVNLVSEPHFPTADNVEANLEIGKRVPTPGALSFGGAGGGSSFTPLQSITREDVTLNIKVTPHVNDEKTLTLDVDIEDKDIAERDAILGVTTTKRKIHLEDILAHDDQPLVLGGLIREYEVMTTKQVPGLGQIPLIGWLFKRKEKTKEKVNLLVIMVPHILHGPADIQRIKTRRTRERLEFMERETRFEKRDIDANVNYRRKPGLLASIDRNARKKEEQELRYRRAQEELNRESVTGEIGLRPRAAEDVAVAAESSTSKSPPKSSASKKPRSEI